MPSGLHSAQSALLLAPAVCPARPNAQSMQLFCVAAPLKSSHRPRGHLMHSLSDGDPSRLLNVPAGQSEHARTLVGCPAAKPNIPAVHSLQKAAPSADWKRPGAQAMHVESAVAPISEEDFPAVHFLHAPISMAPLVFDQRPVVQTLQSSARVRPMAAL